MKGQIRQRGNSYSVIVPLGLDASGKKRYKWVTAHSKREAQAKRAELVHLANSGLLASPKGTLGEFCNRWLDEYATPNLSPTTTEGYRKILKAHMTNSLGKVQLKNIKPEHIQNYYTSLLSKGLSTTTVRHHAMLLHRILEHAVKWQLLMRNPADAVTPPAVADTEMHTLDESQIETILREAQDTPYYVLFFLALHTGMRRSELLALRWQDVDLLTAEISVSRTMHRLTTHEVVFRGVKTAKSRRAVALSPATCVTLRKHLDNEMAVCNRFGVEFTNDRLLFCQWDVDLSKWVPLLPAVVSQAWKRLVGRLGIQDIHFHSIRHSHATLLLKQGINAKIIQERLGHANISVTLNIYAHVSPGMQRQAAEAFDEILSKKNSKRIAE